MIKAIFFDVDDTLLDFELSSIQALKNTCNAYKITFNDEFYNRFKTINHDLWKQFDQGLLTREQIMNTRFKLVLNDESYDHIAINDTFLYELSCSAVLTKNAYTVIETLAKHYPLYIASNSSINIQENRLTKVNLIKYFKDLFCSKEVKANKPSKEFFEYCLSKTNLNPEDVLMVGDNLLSDIIGANNMNIKTCLYNPNNVIYDNNPSDIEIHDLIELLDILKVNQ